MQTTLSDSKLDFSFLDQADFRSRYAYGSRKTSMRFYVSGIQCSKCIRKLEDLPHRIMGLVRVQVNMGDNVVNVEIDPQQTTFNRIAQEISALGFSATAILPEGPQDDLYKKENRMELVRLAVAGACAANIMTFSFATYFGNTAEFGPLFRWLSFLFYLPVVGFVALPFYRGALASLKQKQLSIDLPMAVASLTGFVISTVELLRGGDSIYFDSLSGFLFFILVSRSIQNRLQKKVISNERLGDLQVDRFRVFQGKNWNWSPDFSVGESLLISQNEILPADCELESPVARVSLAWLSGESRSKTFLAGAIVPAGSRLSSQQAVFKVNRQLSETQFGKILNDIQKFSISNSRVVTQADRWSQWLLATVFVVALGFVAFFWTILPEEGIRRALGLIIVACPCAMAFGTPLALASALRRSQRHGILVRNANVFEEMRKIKTAFFDKTGTLTSSELELLEDPRTISPTHQALVLALENRSQHPIAFAFRERLSVPILPIVENWQEIAGHGVSGEIQGKKYELRRDSLEGAHTSCSLFENGRLLETFLFDVALKPDAAEVLESLRAQKIHVVLLSGDKESAVLPMAQQLGFSRQDTHFDLSPEQKAFLITKNPNSLMIGDGLNDSLALMRANVGVAASGSIDGALKSAGVYLLNPELKSLLVLRQISFDVHRLIVSNLTLSLVYNVGAGYLALSGLMNPFLAALLMPVSSGVILLHTWLRGRR